MKRVMVQEDKKDYSTDAGKGFLLIEKIFKAERINPDKPSEKNKYTEAEIAGLQTVLLGGLDNGENHSRGISPVRSITEKEIPQLLKDFFDFCEEYQGRGMSKNLTGVAVNHALNQKDTFMTFLDDPKLELCQSFAECSLRM